MRQQKSEEGGLRGDLKWCPPAQTSMNVTVITASLSACQKHHSRPAHLIQLRCYENVWLLIGSGVLELEQLLAGQVLIKVWFGNRCSWLDILAKFSFNTKTFDLNLMHVAYTKWVTK